MSLCVYKIEDNKGDVLSFVVSLDLLPFSIVKLYIDRYNPSSIKDLKATFPETETGWGYDNLYGNNFFVTKKQFERLKQKDKENKYYLEKPIVLGDDELFVTTQYWITGPAKGKLDGFIKYAEQAHKMKITACNLDNIDETLSQSDPDFFNLVNLMVKIKNIKNNDLQKYVYSPSSSPTVNNMRYCEFSDYLKSRNADGGVQCLKLMTEICCQLLDGADMDLIASFVSFRNAVTQYVETVCANYGVQNASDYADAMWSYFDFFDETYEKHETRRTHNGTATMTQDLRGVDALPYANGSLRGGGLNPQAHYDSNIAQSDEIPGLVEFAKQELLNLGNHCVQSVFKQYDTFKSFNPHYNELPRVILTDKEENETIITSRIGISHQFLYETVLFMIKVIAPKTGTLLDNLGISIKRGWVTNLEQTVRVLICDEIQNNINPQHYELLQYLLVLPSEQGSLKKTATTVIGCYRRTNHTITINYRKLSAEQGTEQYLAEFHNTLAHEFLHYLQDLHGCEFYSKSSSNSEDNELKKRKERNLLNRDVPHPPFLPTCSGRATNIVREAQAEFFAMIYSVDNNFCRHNQLCSHNVATALKRYNMWKQNMKNEWPYSYALFFMKRYGKTVMQFSQNVNDYVANYCIGKYDTVWLLSQQDIMDAYYCLIDE